MVGLKNIYNKHKQLIPLLILLWYCLLIVIEIIYINKVDEGIYPNINHYFAFGAVSACFIIYFSYKPFYKYLILGTLILGCFNLLNFSLWTTTAFININGIRISFAPKAFFALLVMFFLNIKKLSSMVSGPDAEADERVQQLINKQNEEEYNKYLKMFENKSIEELNEIALGKPYSEHAVAAANDLIFKMEQGKE